MLGKIQTDHPNDVRVVFHHYPLDNECNPNLPNQVHPAACIAAVAAECAGEQGKFWEYADLLFRDQREYTVQDLQTYAGAANLDVKSFTACVESGRMKGHVTEDIAEAERIGVKATPTLVINGRLFEGLLSAERFATVLAIETQQAARRR